MSDARPATLSGSSDPRKEVKFLKKLRRDIVKRIKKLRTVRGRENCLRMARTLPPHLEEGNRVPMVITTDRLDLNPWALPCLNGVVNLQTGELKPGRPEDFHTKQAPVKWSGIETPAPHFEAFVKEILDSAELAEYLRRVIGYAATGWSTEPAFFVLHGSGRNGKSVLVRTLQSVLGPLVQSLPSEALLDQGKSRNAAGPSPDILILRGCRIAVASETQEGAKIAEARVKLFSGADLLKARGVLDRKFTEFAPTHTLFLQTNHLPAASAQDSAFWARAHVIKFPFSYIDNPKGPMDRQRDPHLFEKLSAEAPVILAWIVRGCLEWQAQGLNPPEAIFEAVREYRESEDLLEPFLSARCVLGTDFTALSTDLHKAFATWFTEEYGGKYPPNQKRFGSMLIASGQFERYRSDGFIKYRGLKLRD